MNKCISGQAIINSKGSKEVNLPLKNIKMIKRPIKTVAHIIIVFFILLLKAE